MNSYSQQLAEAVNQAVPQWVRRDIDRLLTAAAIARTPDVDGRVDRAVAETVDFVERQLGAFLALDVYRQRTNPLAVLRAAVAIPTRALRDLGVPEVVRGEFEERTFPDDVYGLSPATWRDLDESVHEPGLIWGAWKAKTILDRRRAEGQR